MAYHDPYSGQYASRYQHDPQYGAETQPSQDPFNPYENHHQPATTYDQGAYPDYTGEYRDDPHENPYGVQRQPTTRSNASALPPTGFNDAGSGFDHGEFSPREKTAHNIRAYRYETQGNLWTRGSRVSCIGRFCCCTLLIFLFLFISIVLALLLWVRPPTVLIGDVYEPTTGSTVQLTTDGVTINFEVNVSVSNPNYFGLELKKVSTTLIYPINDTDIGGGTTTDVSFPSHSNKTVAFPFAVNYTTSLDPNGKILTDIAEKCGILGGSSSDITIDYKITVGVRILFVTVSPTISNTFSFKCPLDDSDLEALLKAAGIDISSLVGDL